MYLDLLSDVSFIVPAIKGVKAYSRDSTGPYFYHLEYRYGDTFFGRDIPSWVGAYHVADVILVFGFPLQTEEATTGANFSREVIKMWTNFAKTGWVKRAHM